jgi:lipid II:glycine glycyltransferase (peptidoglycan interpeptide bridge formation enzyme)
MTVRFASSDEITHWNEYVLNNPDNGNILQGYEFAKQKKLGGWTPRFLFIETLAVLVLEKSVFGLGVLWYIPKGPGITSSRYLDELLPSLITFAKNHKVFSLKIEPELLKTDETVADFIKLGLVKVAPIQPNFSTVTLDISDNLDIVMSHLNQKGRHAIKRAQRDGVTTQLVDATDENCQRMYNLLKLTAAGSFRIRSFTYYKTFWQRYATADLGQLFFAYVDGTVVAGAFAIAFGKKGTYKDGASVRERTVYGASHLLQWRIVEWMKARNVTIYDFCGTPPSDQINNPAHPYYGIGRFKTSFNKEVTDYVGAYDIVIKPSAYRIWTKIGERIILRIHNYRYHENYY